MKNKKRRVPTSGKVNTHTKKPPKPHSVNDSRTNSINENAEKCKQSAHIILSALGAGSENGVHLAELIKITGFDNRIVRKTIESLRRAGNVIAADESGYYFPANVYEVRKYIRREERRIKSTGFTLKSARKLLKDYEAGEEQTLD